jgi:hypothetical protein
MAEPSKKKNRISNAMFIMIIGVAIMFEVLQATLGFIFIVLGLIPALGLALWFGGYIVAMCISLFEYLIFWFWLPKPEDSKEWADRAKWFFGSAGLEVVPFISILPLASAGVIQTALLVRKKDREYNEKHAKDVNPLPLNRPRAARIGDASRELRSTPRTSSIAASRLANRPTVNQARA